jgi:hypothetical protein
LKNLRNASENKRRARPFNLKRKSLAPPRSLHFFEKFHDLS